MKKMWNRISRLAVCIMTMSLAVSIWTVTAFAQEPETDEVGEAGIRWKVSSEIEDGIIVIRIESNKDADPEFWWNDRISDKGDASFVELTRLDEEEGLAFCGYYKTTEEDWEGDDTIRVVYTNGHYVAEYMEWTVAIKDGEITEVIGGGQAFPTTAEDMASVLEGVWQEEDGSKTLSAALDEDGRLEITVKDESVDGNNVSYTMHPYYDAEKEALVYWDAVADPAVEADQEEPEGGTGLFGVLPVSEEDPDELAIFWQDNTFENYDTGRFLKAE